MPVSISLSEILCISLCKKIHYLFFTETYEEALNKLARLEKEEHVFTLGSDDNTSGKIEMETIVKQQKLKNQTEELKEIYCA